MKPNFKLPCNEPSKKLIDRKDDTYTLKCKQIVSIFVVFNYDTKSITTANQEISRQPGINS